jgi:protein-tyrosine phosphatase
MKILFVCLGNICRSPAAEAVMKAKLSQRRILDQFEIDSCGTSGYHNGDPADFRMIAAGEKRGFVVDSISRKIYPDHDFRHFDLILAMDESNMNDIRAMSNEGELKDKLFLMTHHHPNESKVFDPYFGGEEGFDLVLDLLEECCDQWLDWIANQSPKNLK